MTRKDSTSQNTRKLEHGIPEVARCRGGCGRRARRSTNGFCGDDCRFWAKVKKGPDCWLWAAGQHVTKRTKEPYGQFAYRGRSRRAHIVAWALTHDGFLPELPVSVLHHCDTPLCVRPDHLFLGTQDDNMKDAAQKGRLHVARPHKQKVTAEQIEVMRSRAAAGETHKAVAADYGIARNTLTEIIQGKRRQYDAPLRPSLEQAG